MFEINNNNQLLLFFTIMALTEITAQFLLKLGSNHKEYINIYFLLGLLAITITYILLYIVLKTGKHISVISAIHHTSIILALAIGSYILFSQSLNSIQLLGLLFLITGTVILAFYENE